MKLRYLTVDFRLGGEADLLFDTETGSLEWVSENKPLQKLANALASPEDWKPENGDCILWIANRIESLKAGEVRLSYPPETWEQEKSRAELESAAGIVR